MMQLWSETIDLDVFLFIKIHRSYQCSISEFLLNVLSLISGPSAMLIFQKNVNIDTMEQKLILKCLEEC